MARHSETERFARANKDIEATIALLGEKRFLFTEVPTAADASVAPLLAAIAASPNVTKLWRRVKADAPLMAYNERVRAALYP